MSFAPDTFIICVVVHCAICCSGCAVGCDSCISRCVFLIQLNSLLVLALVAMAHFESLLVTGGGGLLGF